MGKVGCPEQRRQNWLDLGLFANRVSVSLPARRCRLMATAAGKTGKVQADKASTLEVVKSCRRGNRASRIGVRIDRVAHFSALAQVRRAVTRQASVLQTDFDWPTRRFDDENSEQRLDIVGGWIVKRRRRTN